MALLWFDGFETYEDNTDANTVSGAGVGSISADAACTFDPAYARYAGNGLRIVPDAGGPEFSVSLTSAPATIIVGAAIKRALDNVPSFGSAAQHLIGFSNSANTNMYAVAMGDEIQFMRYYDTILGITAGAGLTYNTWRYIEIKTTINDGAGTIEVYSNGIQVLDLSGIDNYYGGDVGVSKISLGACYLGGVPYIPTYWDDLYICDTTGAQCNDFLGDIRIDAVRPNGAGTYTDFTPSAGANYENVDETDGPDDDTTYNEGTTIGEQDTYAMESLPSPAGTTILGVKSQVTVKKTDAGARGIKVLTRAGTTDDLSPEIALADGYAHAAEILELNPDDSAAWEDADIASMEVGLEIAT